MSEIVVLDDFSTGFRQAVLYGDLIVGNTGDAKVLDELFATHDIDTVMHFAAHTIVPESVADPLKYYRNNTCASRTLLERSLSAGVRHVVFSSTAAVYGMPSSGEASEDSPLAPINAYGTSKLMTEWMLRDVAAATPLRYVALRYFNVAGSDPMGRIGQATAKATLLTKVACEVVVGKRDHVSIFGTDYPTRDGTGVRDYITRRGPRRCPSQGARLSARRRRIDDAELRLRPRLQRARAAEHGGDGRGTPDSETGSSAPSRRSADARCARVAHPHAARLAAAPRQPQRYRRDRARVGTEARGRSMG